jgi:CHAT domain-containing protein/Tfp pilus assembly protein PilF
MEQKIAGGQSHSYQVTVDAGQFVRVSLEQRGIDVSIRVQEPGSKDIVSFDTELRPRGRETAEFVAQAAGTYTIAVAGKYRFPTAMYALEVAEMRPATERERLLDSGRRTNAEAVRLRTAGRYAEAQRLAEQVLAIRERELGPDHVETALALQLLGRLAQDQGGYDRAQQLFARSLRILQAALPADHPDIGLVLDALANTYRAKEEFTTSITLLQQALSVIEKSLGPEHPGAAVVLINSGAVYEHVGDHVKAEQLYRRAMAIQEAALGPEHRNVAVVANNLGVIYRDRGEHRASLPLFQRAVEIFEKALGAEHPLVRDPLMNLAVACTLTGQHANAEAFYERALKLTERVLGSNHPAVGTLLNNYAEGQRAKGDYTRAEVLAQRALAIREAAFGNDHPTVGRVLNTLATISDAAGDTSRAVELQERAAKITERVVALNLAAGSERQKLAYIAGTGNGGWLLDQTSHILSLGLRPDASAKARQLAAAVLLQRKGRVQDSLSQTVAALRRRFSDQDRRSLEELNETTTQIAKLVLGGPGQKSLSDYQQRIRGLEDRREKLEDTLSRNGAELFVSSRPATLAAIRATLPKDAALLEFAVYRPFDAKFHLHEQRLGEPRYAALIVRREGDTNWLDLGAAAAIDRAVTALREALRDPARQDFRERAWAVYKRVMQPLRPPLTDVSHLLVSPDGSLNLIPFAALVDDQGSYLMERYRLSYLTSARDLIRLAARRPDSGSARPLILADPAFDAREPVSLASAASARRRRQADNSRRSITTGADISSVYFAPLPHTAREAQAVHQLFPASLVLTGAGATEAALKQADAPLMLHIATHGFFLADQTPDDTAAGGADRRGIAVAAEIENPLLRSGLALAGANRRAGAGQDGILTALEASGLNLWGTKLVTLSACDTGVGEVRNGEGVYGFRRALVLAGAEALVMSLWPVSDQVTRELMTAYYTRLKLGHGRGEALRQVQLQMFRQQNRRHPFYWAGFIQSGEWANLDGQR